MLSSYGFEIALIYYVVRKRTLTVVVKAVITGFTSEHCSRVILFYKGQMTNYSGIFHLVSNSSASPSTAERPGSLSPPEHEKRHPGGCLCFIWVESKLPNITQAFPFQPSRLQLPQHPSPQLLLPSRQALPEPPQQQLLPWPLLPQPFRLLQFQPR